MTAESKENREGTRGELIVISGPSGVGKSTVIHRLLELRRDIHFSVSYTTRAPREGEENGRSYNFVSRQEFRRMIDAEELLEHAEYVGNFYGTSWKVIREHLDHGTDVLLDIEVQGAVNVKLRCPDAVSIFIIPPSVEELSRRLHARGSDDEKTIADRLQKAREECRVCGIYDYLVVNDTVESCVQEILAILAARKCRTVCRLPMAERIFPDSPD